MRNPLQIFICFGLFICLAGCSVTHSFISNLGWSAIRLTDIYTIDVDDPYETGEYEYIHYTTYLFKKTGVYGELRKPFYTRVARIYIWTFHNNNVYMVGETRKNGRTYYRLDEKTEQLDYSETLADFEEIDQTEQEIFMKLESHPELFTDIQEMGPNNPPYSLNGKGKVDLNDLEF